MITHLLEQHFEPVVVTPQAMRRHHQLAHGRAPHELKAVIVGSHPDFAEGGPGTILLRHDNNVLYLRCPGCGEPSQLHLYGENEFRLTSTLTLRPAFEHDVATCGYRGFLTRGVFTG